MIKAPISLIIHNMHKAEPNTPMSQRAYSWLQRGGIENAHGHQHVAADVAKNKDHSELLGEDQHDRLTSHGVTVADETAKGSKHGPRDVVKPKLPMLRI